MGRRLDVRNPSYNTSEMGLRDAFGQVGTIADAQIVMDGRAIDVKEAQQRAGGGGGGRGRW